MTDVLAVLSFTETRVLVMVLLGSCSSRQGVVKTFTVFTQQIQELSSAIDVSISSQCMESDIAKNFPLNVKFLVLADKITKTIIQK